MHVVQNHVHPCQVVSGSGHFLPVEIHSHRLPWQCAKAANHCHMLDRMPF
jgi:hypothetical protein